MHQPTTSASVQELDVVLVQRQTKAKPTLEWQVLHSMPCVSELCLRAYALPMASSAHARSVPRRQARSNYPLAARGSPRPLPRPHRWPRAARPPALRASGRPGPGPMQRAGPRAPRRCRQQRTRATQLGSATSVASAPGTVSGRNLVWHHNCLHTLSRLCGHFTRRPSRLPTMSASPSPAHRIAMTRTPPGAPAQ